VATRIGLNGTTLRHRLSWDARVRGLDTLETAHTFVDHWISLPRPSEGPSQEHQVACRTCGEEVRLQILSRKGFQRLRRRCLMVFLPSLVVGLTCLYRMRYDESGSSWITVGGLLLGYLIAFTAIGLFATIADAKVLGNPTFGRAIRHYVPRRRRIPGTPDPPSTVAPRG
jgi:hypothetical protein